MVTNLVPGVCLTEGRHPGGSIGNHCKKSSLKEDTRGLAGGVLLRILASGYSKEGLSPGSFVWEIPPPPWVSSCLAVIKRMEPRFDYLIS